MPGDELRNDQHDALITKDIVLKKRRVRDASDSEQDGDYVTQRQINILISQISTLQSDVSRLQLQLVNFKKKMGT